MSVSDAHADEVARGDRFEFGANWKSFLEGLTDEAINEAERSVKKLLMRENLEGVRFLDMGCGSGLFSLAARKLGAEVVSVDYDPQSVECARTLRKRYFPADNKWTVQEGSVLDEHFIKSLGKFDIVYSWGVLHHTGKMWQALDLITMPVNDSGLLAIALYNDEGVISRFWLKVKQCYCSGVVGRSLVLAVFIPWYVCRTILVSMIKYRSPFRYFRNYRKKRGMSLYHDWVDWLGGLPFEVAEPGAVLRFYRERCFSMENLIATNRLGCNQYLFKKDT